MHAGQRLLRHPYVHLLIRLPSATCKPSLVSTWWGRTLPYSTTPAADTAIYVIANPAGLQTYAPAYIHHTLHQTLQPPLHIHGYQLGHPLVECIGPLPNFRPPLGFKTAQRPIYNAPTHGPHPCPILLQYTSGGICASKEPPFSTLMAGNATPACLVPKAPTAVYAHYAPQTPTPSFTSVVGADTPRHMPSYALGMDMLFTRLL